MKRSVNVQRSAKKFFCFAKHDPGIARQKYTQPGKRNLADLCRVQVCNEDSGLQTLSLASAVQ